MNEPAKALPLLTLAGLEVGYDGSAILPAVSVEVEQGQFWAVIGRNGGGKTTLLRTLLGLLPKVRGQVVASPDLRVGYVPQRTELDLSVPARVVDIVRSGLDSRWSFVQPLVGLRRRDLVQTAMDDTEISRLQHIQLAQLSEGQKQRVLMARALVSEPTLLVLDEPTSAMDIEAEAVVFELLEELRKRRNLGIMVVSHHLAVLATRATHVIVVDRDEQWVLPGSLADVGQDAHFIEHYGLTFKQPAAAEAAPVRNEPHQRGGPQ